MTHPLAISTLAAMTSSLVLICAIFNGVSVSSQWVEVPHARIGKQNSNNKITPGKIGQSRSSLVDMCKADCEGQDKCSSFVFSDSVGCEFMDKRASHVVGGLQSASEDTSYFEPLGGRLWVRIPNAATFEHNREKKWNQNLASCTAICESKPWCKSFDWKKDHGMCALSEKTAFDVGGLKLDYPGDPYDYYEPAPKTELMNKYEGRQAIAPAAATRHVVLRVCVGSISLGGLAMGLIALRRAYKQAGQEGRALIELDDETEQMEQQ